MEELDVTKLARGSKHATIQQRLSGLAQGETLRIFNDHDPRPLRLELDAEFPGQYTWNYVESGPQNWRVDIARRPANG